MLARVPVVIAPRGEFSPKVLQLKWAKKQIYIRAVRLFGLYRRVIWQASSLLETEDIRRTMGPSCIVRVAPNIATPIAAAPVPRKPTKLAGQARFVFLSRISPKKNLQFALEVLLNVTGSVIFDIYGPRENQEHWARCEAVMRALPAHVRATYRGTVNPPDVVNVLSEYHFFLFPTLGENFGHVIFEALAARCPVLVSDQTPWRNLAEKRAGWDLPLNDRQKWYDAVSEATAMDNATYLRHSDAAAELAAAMCSDPDIESQNLALFGTTLLGDAVASK